MKRALRILALLPFVLPLAAAAAAPAYLVKDIKTGLDPFDPAFPHPSFFGYAAVNGRVVFFGLLPEGSLFGNQSQCGLWSTDGTPAGTTRLADLCDRLGDLNNHQFRMLATNGAVAFLTDVDGRLWRTDGSAAGTFPLGAVQADNRFGLDVAIGPGGVLFFSGCTPESGCEPWRSDGTRKGTRRLRDILPGRNPSNATGFTADGARVLFTAAGGLWSTDGTPAGTVVLAQVAAPGAATGRPVRAGGRIYFTVFPATADVWYYDPSTRKAIRLGSFANDRYDSGAVIAPVAGRVLVLERDREISRSVLAEIIGNRVRPLGPPFEFYRLGPVREVGGKVVFAASRQTAGNPEPERLWALAPGASRPTLLKDCPEGCPTVDYDQATMVLLRGRLYFAGRDARHGRELWSTDGTGPGTRLVKDLCPGACDGNPSQLTAVLGRLVFDDTTQRGFWTSDGTPAGTVLLGHVGEVLSPFAPLDLAPLGNRIVFSAFDGASGYQPWTSDLTPAGTARITDLGGALAASSWPFGLAALGGKVLFQACDNAMGGLWASDGTEGGTVQLPGSDVPCEPTTRYFKIFMPVGEIAFYVWNGQLWRTDGTEAGTLPLADPPALRPLSLSGAPLGSRLLFVEDSGTFWTSDGTPQGTREAFSFRFGGGPGAFTTSGGLVYFYAQAADSPFPTQIWRTDGTEAGTFPILSGTGGGDFEIPMVRLGLRTFFIAAQRAVGPELWSTDGTVAGTAPVVPALTGERPRNPPSLTVFQGALYFFALTNDQAPVWGLWRSDGTAAGTRLVQALPLPRGYQTGGAVPLPELTATGSFLFFRLDDNVHGTELWRSDGTAAGTVMVKDVDPGPATSRIDGLTAAGGRVFFGATDGEHGYELWESDGTEAGTRMVRDINPGPAPSNPDQLTAADGHLYFNADDGEHGRELWALPLPR